MSPEKTVPTILAKGVTKSYGQKVVLESADLEVHAGEVCCILGPSGAGKSTFLRCLNFLEEPDSGHIWVSGELVGLREGPRGLHKVPDRLIAPMRARLSMVFQDFGLFPHMTALQNVMEGPIQVLRRPKDEVRADAMQVLKRVGLGDHCDKYPSEMSGGQQQRVGIARALAMKPAAILFDEPTSALDPELVGEVLEVMHNLASEGMTMVMVTHEVALAKQIADVVVFMDHGRVIERGGRDLLTVGPKSERSAAFLSSVLS